MTKQSMPQVPPKNVVRITAMVLILICIVTIAACIMSFDTMGVAYALSVIVVASALLFFSGIALITGSPEWILLSLLHSW